MCRCHPRCVLASTSTGHPRSAPVPCLCHRAPMDTIRVPPPPTVRTSAPTCCPPMLMRCPHRLPTLYMPPLPSGRSHAPRTLPHASLPSLVSCDHYDYFSLSSSLTLLMLQLRPFSPTPSRHQSPPPRSPVSVSTHGGTKAGNICECACTPQ